MGICSVIQVDKVVCSIMLFSEFAWVSPVLSKFNYGGLFTE